MKPAKMLYQGFSVLISSKTNEELIEIYLKPENYQAHFVDLVIQELNNRNVDLSSYQLKKRHREDFYRNKYESGRPGNPTYITIGFISAMLGGLLGIYAGYVYSRSKHKYIGDGDYYVYDEKTRELGNYMMALGIVILLLVLGYNFLE